MFSFNNSCFENYFRYKDGVENIYDYIRHKLTLDIKFRKLNSSMLNQIVSMFVE